MLKGVPSIISPLLLQTLCEMGHGDRLCIGDGNFPAAVMAKANDAVLIKLDGHGVNEILDAILTLVPLDDYTDTPVMLMEKVESDRNLDIPIWKDFEKTVKKYDKRGKKAFGSYERFEFYEQAKQCHCIIRTGEKQGYANIILQKGGVDQD